MKTILNFLLHYFVPSKVYRITVFQLLSLLALSGFKDIFYIDCECNYEMPINALDTSSATVTNRV